MPTRRGLIAGMASLPIAGALPARAAPPRPRLLRRAAHVLTMQGPPLTDADVLVSAGAIRAVGKDLPADGAEIVDMRGHIVAPGLVDTHWHMWNTIARGLERSSRGGFGPTMAAIAPLFTPGDNAVGVRLALAEAVSAGITTVHNWAHNIVSPAHADAEIAAMVASGVRGRFAYGYPQVSPPDREMDLAHLASIGRTAPSALVTMGMCARGPDRSSDAVWHAEWDAARRLALPISTHMASDAKAATLRGIARLAARDGLGRDVQLVHLTAVDDAALGQVIEAGSPVSISPWTELAVGYGVPPVAKLARAGATLGLSVDNMVLAGRADMFSVMRLAGDLAAGEARDQNTPVPGDALRWATIGGATSLGLSDRVGTIAPGKRADLIAIRTDATGLAPIADPLSLLTHAARPDDVAMVIIDGEIHKRNGRLTRVDAAALRADATAAIARIRAQAGI